MEARLYTFNKKRNSTAIPSNQVGIVVDVVLKIETSYNAPSFVLYIDSPKDYNYLQFDGAWYFITDIVAQRNNLWRLDCVIDALATCRDDIFNTSSFIQYKTGGYTDVADIRIAQRGAGNVTNITRSIGVNQQGYFLLSAVGETGVTQWEIPLSANLKRVLESVADWGDNLLNGATDLLSAFQVAFSQLITSGGATENIRDCRWIPFAPSGGVGGTVSLGRYNTGVAAGSVTTPFRTGEVNIDVPFSRSSFMRVPPYAEVLLSLPFVGTINISSHLFSFGNRVTVVYSIDNRSGDIAYRVEIAGTVYGCYGASTAVSIPIGVSNLVSGSGLLTGVTAAALSAAYGNVAGAIGGALSVFNPTSSSVGGIQGGAGVGINTNVIVSLSEHTPTGAIGNMDAVQGTPFFATGKIGDISGYCQTQGFSLQGAYRLDIIDSVNSMLDAGVYIE